MRNAIFTTLMLFVAFSVHAVNPPTTSIVGKWNVQAYFATMSVQDLSFKIDMTDAIQTFQFNADGTWTSTGYENRLRATDMIKAFKDGATVVKPKIKKKQSISRGTYVQKGNQLILKGNGEQKVTYTIVSHQNGKLHLKVSAYSDADNNTGDVEIRLLRAQ